MKRVILLFLLLLAVPAAHAGGPAMAVGAAEDVVKTPDPAFAKAELDKAKLAGLDTVRITTIWVPGQTKVGVLEAIQLKNVAVAAKFDGIRVVVTLMHAGSRTTPLADEDKAQFAKWAADVAKRFPSFRDFIIGNEPNLNRFWMPQYDPLDGHDVAAGAYVSLLATAYDAIKAVAPRTTVYGGALAPRGVDKPGTGRDTHSPTTFIPDMGAAYRASGREIPIMDALAFHPYADNSSQPPDFAHPNSSSIGIADYPKLVSLLGQAFDGTAQKGSTLPILYDEFGVETTIPATKASLYTGAEIPATKPVDEATQAQFYRRAIELSFCQPTVTGLLLFHVVDEPQLGAWQSGMFYVDGAPKASLYPVRTAAFSSRRGIVAKCEGMQLTPKVVIDGPGRVKLGAPVAKAFLTCAIDCDYTVRLEDAATHAEVGRQVGMAIGRKTRQLGFVARKLRPGSYRFTVQAAATVNVGALATGVSRAFSVR